MTPTSGVTGIPDPGTSQQKGGFFQRMLPTAGGILGGIAGAALAPETGGLSLLIPAVAAGLGGAAGKAAENVSEGQNIGQGVEGSALSNAIGAGTGGILGKGISAIAGKVISPLAESGAAKTLQGQFKGFLDSDTSHLLRNGMGISDARQVADLTPLATTGEGAIYRGVINGLKNTDQGVDLSGLQGVGTKLLSDNQMQLNPASINAIQDKINKSLISSLNPEDVTQVPRKGISVGNEFAFAPGALKNVLPENAFTIAKNYEQLASSALDAAKGVNKADQLAKFKIFNGLAQEAKSAAFGGDTPIPLSPENRAQIIADLAPMKELNPQAYNWHVNGVSNATNLQDLRPIQAPLTQASVALNALQKATAGQGGLSASDLARGTLGLARGPKAAAAGMVLSSPGIDRSASSLLGSLSKSTGSANAQKMIPLLTRSATIAGANLPNDIPQPAGNVQSNIAPGAIPGAGTGQAMNPYSQLLNEAMTSYTLDPAQYAGSSGALLQAILPQLQKSAIAEQQLGGQQAALANAGGPQGALGGLLSRLTGLIPGTPQSALNAQTGQLAQTLGIQPGAISNVMQTPGTAGIQTGTLQAIINAMYGGGSSFIPSALPVQ